MEEAHTPPHQYQNPATDQHQDFTSFNASLSSIRSAAAQVIVGQQELLDLIITGMIANGHILLEGVPGIAKTLTARVFSELIEAEFNRIQFTPDLMPADVLGTTLFNMKNSEFEFHKGPIFKQIILIDEINRAPAKTQAALFEVMEEQQVSIDGVTYTMEEPFQVLATQNPVEQEGTYRLPEAQLDRFLFKLTVDYPSAEEEMQILQNSLGQSIFSSLDDLKAVLKTEDLIQMRQKVHEVYIAPTLLEYITLLAKETRNHAGLYLGASPRASLAFLQSSRAYALLQGRDYVIPEDIQFLAAPILRHRLLLTADREMEGIRPDTLVQEILQAVELPR